MWIYIIIAVIIIIIALSIAVIYHDTHSFVVRNYEIRTDKIDGEYTFVLLSDLHGYTFGPNNERLIEAVRDIKPDAVTTRTSLMGMLAMKEALDDANLTREDIHRAAFVSGTTVGGMDKTEQYYLDFINNDKRNKYIVGHDCGTCSEMICDYFGDFAFVTSVSTACSSAANAIIRVKEFFETQN